MKIYGILILFFLAAPLARAEEEAPCPPEEAATGPVADIAQVGEQLQQVLIERPPVLLVSS